MTMRIPDLYRFEGVLAAAFHGTSATAEQGGDGFLARMEESGSNIRYSPSGTPNGQLSGKMTLSGAMARPVSCLDIIASGRLHLMLQLVQAGGTCKACDLNRQQLSAVSAAYAMGVETPCTSPALQSCHEMKHELLWCELNIRVCWACRVWEFPATTVHYKGSSPSPTHEQASLRLHVCRYGQQCQQPAQPEPRHSSLTDMGRPQSDGCGRGEPSQGRSRVCELGRLRIR